MTRGPAAVAARLGETIRRERRTLGLTQDELALAAGLGLRAVHDIEAGKVTAQLRTWLKAAEALNLETAFRPQAPTAVGRPRPVRLESRCYDG